MKYKQKTITTFKKRL